MSDILYILDVANNHNASKIHASNIIDQHYKVIQKYNINAAFKLQFRQLETFIAPSYKNSDKKFIKRFRETELSKQDFKEIVEYIRYQTHCKVAATPFDNESLEWIKEFDVDIVKIASCSIDDWALLKEVVQLPSEFVISTAGASTATIDKVYDLFDGKKFSLLHCVAEYPTPLEHANLQRITQLKQRYNVPIGYSTHEVPDGKTADYAIALGAEIIEKHIGLERPYGINAYSLTPLQLDNFFFNSVAKIALQTTDPNADKLQDLKRYIFAKQNIPSGKKIALSDLYFAIPCLSQDLNIHHCCVSELDDVLNSIARRDIVQNEPITLDCILKTNNYITQINNILKQANITVSHKDEVELSCHYGLNKFEQWGCCTITKINREYCKKLIIVLPQQHHPKHHHLQKEETFELLYGDCMLVVNDQIYNLKLGETVTIYPMDKHSFNSQHGCIIEEISTTHYLNDSIYEDPTINALVLSDRKIKIKLC